VSARKIAEQIKLQKFGPRVNSRLIIESPNTHSMLFIAGKLNLEYEWNDYDMGQMCEMLVPD
jgi:hypothetical protein